MHLWMIHVHTTENKCAFALTRPDPPPQRQPRSGLGQTSSGGGYRPSRSVWRPCRRASVLRRSMSSGAVCSNTDGRRTSGDEFFRSKILEAQLPRGVSSRLSDRRFASSCETQQRDGVGGIIRALFNVFIKSISET